MFAIKYTFCTGSIPMQRYRFNWYTLKQKQGLPVMDTKKLSPFHLTIVTPSKQRKPLTSQLSSNFLMSTITSTLFKRKWTNYIITKIILLPSLDFLSRILWNCKLVFGLQEPIYSIFVWYQPDLGIGIFRDSHS